MVEYVYAVHDFIPEHEDEITFRVGERIEVIQKDEQYGDGWWTGRNAAGKEGLFPQGYTSSEPPAVPHMRTSTGPLQPLSEEPDPTDGTVMAATMTDVQEAIEQLAVNRNDHNASRSFSFASTQGSEMGGSDREGEEDQDYHRDARNVLAQRLDALGERSANPPIAVEMSDESEDEDDVSHGNDLVSRVMAARSPSPSPSSALYDEPTSEQLSPLQRPILLNAANASTHSLPTPTSPTTPADPAPHTPVEASRPSELPVLDPPQTPSAKTPLPTAQTPTTAREHSFPQVPQTVPPPSIPAALPSPAASMSGAQYVTVPSPPPVSRDASTKEVATNSSMLTPAPTLTPATSANTKLPPASVGTTTPLSSHPSEWTVDQVVDWARSKGFDDSVCSKLREHDISGDILLEFDAEMLKEIEIPAFGKRKRLANAIVELRRPPSLISSDAGLQAPALPSPGPALSPESPPHTGDLVGTPVASRSRRDSDPGALEEKKLKKTLLGLGFASAIGMPGSSSAGASPSGKKNRPASLALSPSDGALASRNGNSPAVTPNLPEDRAILSDGETVPKRRKGFGWSTESTSSRPASDVKDGTTTAPSSIPPSPGSRGADATHHRGKRSVDFPKPHESNRLSFFSSSLTKSRKPPPRYSSGGSEHGSDTSPTVGPPDRTARSLSRLHFGSHGPRRPAPASNTSSVSQSGPAKDKDVGVLRKRTLSTSDALVLKIGQSVLDQIGKPDYEGWMRKKGDRYNTWKLRYFVLKGADLYILRSKAETKLKGYINIQGYKVIADENANPGRYGFRIIHDTEKPHYFSSEEQSIVREWMKALMKATIGRDYTKPVMSSANIPTIPLSQAQAMNPPPRPPSPTSRNETQRKALRPNPHQLSSRDARILMGLPSDSRASTVEGEEDRHPVDSYVTVESMSSAKESDGYAQGSIGRKGSVRNEPKLPSSVLPVRPSREVRRPSVSRDPPSQSTQDKEAELLQWLNSHLSNSSQKATDFSSSLSSGLLLFRAAESIKGVIPPSSVPDHVFSSSTNNEQLDGMFTLFNFLVDNDVKMGSVTINDIKQGKKEKVLQIVKALKAWEEKRIAIARAVGGTGVGMHTGPWIAPVGSS